jgi:hypothetical protein
MYIRKCYGKNILLTAGIFNILYCISSLHHVRDGNNIREENKNQAWNRQTRQQPGVEQTDKKLNNCLSPLQTNRSYSLEVDNF